LAITLDVADGASGVERQRRSSWISSEGKVETPIRNCQLSIKEIYGKKRNAGTGFYGNLNRSVCMHTGSWIENM
jgi:hypothetical protein